MLIKSLAGTWSYTHMIVQSICDLRVVFENFVLGMRAIFPIIKEIDVGDGSWWKISQNLWKKGTW